MSSWRWGAMYRLVHKQMTTCFWRHVEDTTTRAEYMDWIVRGHPYLRGPRELEVQLQVRRHIGHRLSLSSKLNCIPPNPSCKPPKLSYKPRRNACAPLRMSSKQPERSSKPPGGSSELTFLSCTLGLIAFHQGLGIQRLVAVTRWTPRRLWCA